MGYAGAGRAGATYKFWRPSNGYITVPDIIIDSATGETSNASFNSLANQRKAYNVSGETTYTPKHVRTTVIFPSFGGYVDSRETPQVALPVATSGGTAASPWLTVTGNATTAQTIDTIPIGSLGGGRTIRITASGKRTGAVGAKTASLTIQDTGAATSIPISLATTTADDWSAEIEIRWTGRLSQVVTVNGQDVTYMAPSVTALTKDNQTYPITLQLSLAVPTAAETMTVEALTMSIS
jgi:hypothetical protein